MILGNSGDDMIVDGLGNDIYSGGRGSDTFVFLKTQRWGRDIIVDLDGRQDTILIRAGDDFDLERTYSSEANQTVFSSDLGTITVVGQVDWSSIQFDDY